MANARLEPATRPTALVVNLTTSSLDGNSLSSSAQCNVILNVCSVSHLRRWKDHAGYLVNDFDHLPRVKSPDRAGDVDAQLTVSIRDWLTAMLNVGDYRAWL